MILSLPLIDNKGESYHSEFVVLATGIMDIQPVIGKNIRPILPYANVQLVDYCIRCDGHHTYKKHTGIIGHTTEAAWVAIILYERYELPSMTLLTNGENLKIDRKIKNLADHYGINIRQERSSIS